MVGACLESNKKHAEDHELVHLAGTALDDSTARGTDVYMKEATLKCAMDFRLDVDRIAAYKPSQSPKANASVAHCTQAAHSLTIRLEQQQKALLCLRVQQAQHAQRTLFSRPTPLLPHSEVAAAGTRPAAAKTQIPSSLTPTRIPAPPQGYKAMPDANRAGLAAKAAARLAKDVPPGGAWRPDQGVLLAAGLEQGVLQGHLLDAVNNPLFQDDSAEDVPKPSLIQRMEAAHAVELQRQQQAHHAELAQARSRHGALLQETEARFQQALQGMQGRHAAALEAAQRSQQEAAAQFHAQLDEVQQQHAQQIRGLERELRAVKGQKGRSSFTNGPPSAGNKHLVAPQTDRERQGAQNAGRDENERRPLLSATPTPPKKANILLWRSGSKAEKERVQVARSPLLEVDTS